MLGASHVFEGDAEQVGDLGKGKFGGFFFVDGHTKIAIAGDIHWALDAYRDGYDFVRGPGDPQLAVGGRDFQIGDLLRGHFLLQELGESVVREEGVAIVDEHMGLLAVALIDIDIDGAKGDGESGGGDEGSGMNIESHLLRGVGVAAFLVSSAQCDKAGTKDRGKQGCAKRVGTKVRRADVHAIEMQPACAARRRRRRLTEQGLWPAPLELAMTGV